MRKRESLSPGPNSKKYCYKVILANSNLKVTYPNTALFLILSRSLPASFQLLTRTLIAQPTLSIAEKIGLLVEHEMDIRDKETKTENTYCEV
jgi:hypothetical protein